MIPRILFGAKNRRGRPSNKGRSVSTSKSLSENKEQLFNPVDLIDSNENFDFRRFEIYYRLFLLCQYYYNYFQEQMQSVQSPDSNTILLFIKPTNNSPEGSLFRYLFKLFKESTVTKKLEDITINISNLKEYILYVDRII